MELDQEPTLDHNEFRAQYRRYLRCDRAIQRYAERQRRRISRRRASPYQDDVFLERLMMKVKEEFLELDYLAATVAAGRATRRGDLDDGGAGMPAYRRPDLPVLVGAGAKFPPHLDPEPWARDP